ncbi:MAG TPA: hypothetical protein VF170_01580, partial [Planctomycetaceae bacterium]
QLRRKFDDFRRMSETERQEIRRIHEAVQGDESLRRTLLEYGQFVASLDPWEQAELRKLAPQERLGRVEALIAERQRRGGRGRPVWLAGRFPDGWVIPREQLDEATDLLSESAVPAAERDRIRNLPAHVRHLEIVRHAAAKYRSGRPDPTWPDEATARRVLELLPESRFKGIMLRQEQPAELLRETMFAVLTRSLVSEWQAEAVRLIPAREIQEALAELPEREQAESARRDPGELLRRVLPLIARRGGPSGELAKRFAEVVQLWVEFDPFAPGHRGPRGFFSPPGRRGFDGDRRGFDGNRRGGPDGPDDPRFDRGGPRNEGFRGRDDRRD